MKENTYKYSFIKLPLDWQSNLRIKKLRANCQHGDTAILIYLKLLSKVVNYGGYFIYEEIDSDIYEEIAEKLNEDIDNVKMTISHLKVLGLCNRDEFGNLYFPEANELVATTSYTKVFKNSTREKEKESLRDRDRELEKEEEQDVELDGEIRNRTILENNNKSKNKNENVEKELQEKEIDPDDMPF